MPAPKRQQGMSISKHDEAMDDYIASLEASVDELRQSLIGGIELVKARKPMERWAKANERLLARRR
jgi:hypothetical protein